MALSVLHLGMVENFEVQPPTRLSHQRRDKHKGVGREDLFYNGEERRKSQVPSFEGPSWLVYKGPGL